jgi:hypothetical protein
MLPVAQAQAAASAEASSVRCIVRIGDLLRMDVELSAGQCNLSKGRARTYRRAPVEADLKRLAQRRSGTDGALAAISATRFHRLFSAIAFTHAGASPESPIGVGRCRVSH